MAAVVVTAAEAVAIAAANASRVVTGLCPATTQTDLRRLRLIGAPSSFRASDSVERKL
jgi:hypothetical protein